MNAASTPTPRSHRASSAASRPCLAYPIEVVAFTRLPRAKALATVAIRQGQRACSVATNRRYLGRWGLLAGAALCAWQSAAGQSPATPAARPETIAVRGVVFDDSLNVPIPGLFLYLNGTKYGAITDAQGEFSFSFPTAWKPVRGGVLSIRATPVPYTFKEMRVQLDWRTHDQAQPLTMRLASAPGRGRPRLHGFILIPPPVPPPVYPPSSHTGRP
jgi:hypothetical protein